MGLILAVIRLAMFLVLGLIIVGLIVRFVLPRASKSAPQKINSEEVEVEVINSEQYDTPYTNSGAPTSATPHTGSTYNKTDQSLAKKD